jgi:hypothetical protein
MPRGTECAAHVHKMLVPQERHHVWPLGYHGPDTRDNLVLICCNAHSDVHYMMEAMLKGKPVDMRTYGPGVRRIAIAGYKAVMAYGAALSRSIERGGAS